MNLLPFTVEDVMELKDDIDEMDEKDPILHVIRFTLFRYKRPVLVFTYNDDFDIPIRLIDKHAGYILRIKNKSIISIPMDVDLSMSYIHYVHIGGDDALVTFSQGGNKSYGDQFGSFELDDNSSDHYMWLTILENKNLKVPGLYSFSGIYVKMELD